MYFRSLHIDGFGIYHDCSLADLPPGLIVISGDNESGKTTLMQFFRHVLFGIPRRSPNIYLPLRGGQHGGRIEMLMHDGRKLIVERIGKKATITDSDGTSNAEPAQRILNGIDRQTYERVFAITLDDLQGFDVLTQEGVRGRLLSAGAGLGAASVPDTLKAIDKRLDELLTAKGRKQRVLQLTKELTEISRTIRQQRSQATEFGRLTERRRRLNTELTAARQQQRALQAKLERLRQLENARAVWIRLEESRERIGEFEHAAEFPPDGVSRFERIDREYQESNAAAAEAEQRVERLEQQIGGDQSNSQVIESKESIEQLLAEREKLASAAGDQPIQQQETTALAAEFENRLADLGPDWSEQRLAQVDTSVNVRQQVQQFGRELLRSEQESEDARRLHEAAQRRALKAEQVCSEFEQRLNDAPQLDFADPDQIIRHRRTVRSLHTQQSQLASIGTQLELFERSRRDMEHQLKQSVSAAEEAASVIPAWAAPAALLLAMVIAVPFAISGDWTTAAVAGGLGVVLAATIAGIRVRLVQSAKRQRQQAAERELELKQALESLQRETHQLSQQQQTLKSSISEMLNQSGLESAEESVLQDREEQLERASEALQARYALDAQVADKRRERQEADDESLELHSRLTTAQQETDRLREDWRAWLLERGYDATIRPEQFEVILQAVDAARQARKALQSASRRLQEIESYLRSIQERIDLVADAAAVEIPAKVAGVEAIDFLGRVLAEAQADSQRRSELRRQLHAARDERDRAVQQAAERRNQLNELLADAQATDENEFRKFAVDHESWKQLHHQIIEDTTALTIAAGSPEAVDGFLSDLAARDPHTAVQDLEELDQQIQVLEKSVSAGDQEIGELNKELTDMAHDESLSAAMLDQRVLQEQLGRATREWAVHVICRALLEKAREVYERERQPSVVQKAERFLRTMVADRYRLISALGGEGMELESDSLERKHVQAWSSGLSDQVYLATRMGLAAEFGQHAEPLPLIFDDVLVRFDAKRREAAATALLDMAAEQQLLLFSCHPEVVDAVRAASRRHPASTPEVGFYRLHDGTIEPDPEPQGGNNG